MSFKNKYELIYEDNDLLIVNKPPGISVIPDRSKDFSLAALLRQKYPEVYTVHRIDRDASGLICFAKNKESHKSLSMAFQNREVHKKYHLLTLGVPSQDHGIIDLPLLKSKNKNHSFTSSKGKPSKTEYWIEDKIGGFALIKARIYTGRHHQIRVHFASISCPLLVDPIYSKDSFYLSSIKRTYKRSSETEKPLLSRLSLHAHYLEFKHPNSNKTLYFSAPIPKDFNACYKQLKKWIRH